MITIYHDIIGGVRKFEFASKFMVERVDRRINKNRHYFGYTQ